MAGLKKVNLVLMTTLIALSAVKAVDTRLRSRTCNGNLFEFFTFSEEIIKALINHIVEDTPKADVYENYPREMAPMLPILCGHGVCTETITTDECSLCLQSAKDQLFDECSNRAIGARIQLNDCRIRYEEYKFNNDG